MDGHHEAEILDMYKYLIPKTSELLRPRLCWVNPGGTVTVVSNGKRYSRELFGEEQKNPIKIESMVEFREILETLADPRYWTDERGELSWMGESPDGNEIAHHDARELAMALLQYLDKIPLAPFNDLDIK